MSSQTSISRVYFDHNATTPMLPDVRDAVLGALDLAGNPSSVHAEGRAAKKAISDSRAAIANLLDIAQQSVVFTSGATEAANHVLHGGWSHIFFGAGEHDCIRTPLLGDRLTNQAYEIRLTPDGIVDLAELEGQLEAARIAHQQSDEEWKPLICIQFANNETGILQPVEKVVALAQAHEARVLCDLVQAVGKVPVSFSGLNVDFGLVSAHKFGGPKGVGALLLKDGVSVPAFIWGGGQERRARAGTENVPGIVGFGAAAKHLAARHLDAERTARLRDDLEQQVLSLTPQARIIGADSPRLPNTTALVLPGASAETLVIGLDLAGVAVSSGAACSSGKVGQSHVLEAMGISQDLVKSVVRMSLGWNSSKNEVDRVADAWSQVTARLVSARLAS